jgi:poly(3-hydroxyoctanoate) depolymerase
MSTSFETREVLMPSQTKTRSAPTESDAGIRYVRVVGQRLKVAIRRGNGTCTPLLIFNGIGANLELLQPFVDALDSAIEVIRFDVPGVGGSPTPLVPLRFPALAWLAGRMLDRLGYSRVDVLGVSWGGALAQQFAFQHLWRCRRLVLVSTATGAIMMPGKPSVLVKMATPRRYFDTSYMKSIAPDIYGGGIDPELVHDFADAMRPGDARGYFYQMLTGSGWTSVPWLHFVRQRTLIVSGDSDPLIPLVNAKLMHRLIPRSKLHVFHGGHLGVVVQAQEVAPVISSFLAAP